MIKNNQKQLDIAQKYAIHNKNQKTEGLRQLVHSPEIENK